ncbi:MAG: tryptophan--tRNA ligase [Spirochaetota bacterium]|nr:tryptophan--tRNA ligase [Spirochaetota bacterium]
MNTCKRSLSGIKPTGNIHLGNYLGAVQGFINLQAQKDINNFYFIADYHALNSSPDPKALRQLTLDMFKSLIALGLDTDISTIFIQSDVPEHTELCWLLTSLTPVGLMERAHAYKDIIAHEKNPNMGLLSYPILQAADILMYDPHFIPVGADQKQHIEITRDLAEKFNRIYGDTFVVPEPLIQESVAIIPGTNGEKMSKSKNNTIEIFGSEKEIKKQVMSITTDSTPLEEAKEFNTCTVYNIYKFLATPTELTEMQANYKNGNYGYGHAKIRLYEKILEYFEEARRNLQELNNNEDEVYKLIKKGAYKAQEYARPKINQVRKAVGLGALNA